MAQWNPYKDETEYRDAYSIPKLASGVPEVRDTIASLEGTLKALPSQHGQELRTLAYRNTQPVSTWPLNPTPPAGTLVIPLSTLRATEQKVMQNETSENHE
eukprot:CAMPEP_0202899364 /NCGR_PEP_ID=MMETSP1392-20130828/7623_1 /ASSEMBLY_ACC=CAM_ASM_000868 /TAXON_ID=225041 /ORGANISM="Chlamydomonas chlamydogama, Strain SAG 11-48b" /LENGTH=100 /DNA_ID=CAMNT_0049585529 /DNA_START=150 /DNA_END=452 /DNA_ORIENTATION=-